MIDGLVQSAAASGRARERKVEGVTIAQVVNNVDSTNRARVQVRMSWLPDFEPWARVATPMAGANCGSYFIPQIGDEVLVAFHHGDVREPYILGSLWNGQDGPPSTAGSDATTLRLIRTPLGHEVAFDDAAQTITITSNVGQTVTLASDKLTMATAGSTASVTLELSGKLTLQASVSIDITAPLVKIGGTQVTVSGDASATLEGKATCAVKGGLVTIN